MRRAGVAEVHQIRFIYFDLGNVLLDFSHEIACRNMAELVDVAPELVRQLVFEAELELAYERGDLTTEQFYEHFCAGTGTRPELGALCHATSNIFTLKQAMVPLLMQLRKASHRLGILSNTCDAHWRFCEENFPQLREFFDVHALSFQLRMMKPDAAIYAKAAQMVSTLPQEIFFTDDRIENVHAAVEAGWDAVLFRSPEELERQLRERGLLS
jgi:FMN phosphatase YigB (HAD superfamily)